MQPVPQRGGAREITPGIRQVACSLDTQHLSGHQDRRVNKPPNLGLPEAPPSLVKETDVKGEKKTWHFSFALAEKLRGGGILS